MFGPAGDPDRIDGRMLEHPELVGRLRFALIGKPAHRLVGRHVLGEAEVPDDRWFANVYSRLRGNKGGSQSRSALHGAIHNTIVTIG
jgi:hypothetical protein